MTGTLPYVEYTKLAPGHYTLRVEAVSSDGVPASNKLDFDITIMPPWWAAWWAYLAYALAVATAAYYLNSITRRRRQAEDELQKEKLEREKSKASIS